MTAARASLWHGAPMYRWSAALALLWSLPALADAPGVVAASAQKQAGRWTVTVTLQHAASGWDHFASGFAVLTPDGTRIGYLDLTHPDMDQGRVTASLRRLTIAGDTPFVLIRTRCSLVGWAAEPVRVDLPR